MYAVHHGDDIGARLPLHVDEHGRQIVRPGRQTAIFRPVNDVSHVRQPERRAIAVGDDQVLVRGRRPELIVGVQHERPLGTIEVALRLVDVSRRHDLAQRLEVQVVRGECLRVRLDAHGRPLAARDADEPDAGQLRQLLCHARVHEIVHLRQRHGLRGDRQREHRRIGRVHLVVNRRLRQVVRQQGVGRVDGRLHLLLRNVELLLQGEPQRDDRCAA